MCLAAGEVPPERFKLEVGDPAGLPRPGGRCPGAAAEPIVHDAKPKLPYARATTTDGCEVERVFRKRDGVRDESWRFESRDDGGLRAVLLWVVETHPDWSAEGGDPDGDGRIGIVKVTERPDGGEVSRQVSLVSSSRGPVSRHVSTPVEGGEIEEQEETFRDGGWVVTDLYRHPRQHGPHLRIP